MKPPMADVRILDFTHVIAGPFATSLLADYGADVIRVETSRRTDWARTTGPFPPGVARGPETSALHITMNRNKRSIALDLKHPGARDIVYRLVDQCDVVIENFSAGAMDRLGLGPETLRQRNPRLIYLSMAGLGHVGPRAGWLSFNSIIQGLSGQMLVTGRPDDPPLQVSNSWADFFGGLQGALMLVAALDRRRHTGAGTWLDLSQYEGNVLPLGHLLLAAQATAGGGAVGGHGGGAGGDDGAVGRLGNRSALRIPQGCYPCAGSDAWCVISVGSTVEWQALVQVLGDPVLAEPRYLEAAERQQEQDAIDAHITAWTQSQPAAVVERHLVAAGVPAAAVRSNIETVRDLRDQVHLPFPALQTMTHPAAGVMPVLLSPIHFPDTPMRLDHPGPLLGADTFAVLQELLALSQEEYVALQAEGVFT